MQMKYNLSVVTATLRTVSGFIGVSGKTCYNQGGVMSIVTS